MRINLFIVTYPQSYEPDGKLCLAVRRTGYLDDNRCGLKVMFPGKMEPTVVSINNLPIRSIKDDLVYGTRTDLGGRVATAVDKAISRNKFIRFDTGGSNTPEAWYGVFIPNILKMSRLPFNYGCLDLVNANDLIDQEKQLGKLVREVSVDSLKDKESKITKGLLKFISNSGKEKKVTVVTLNTSFLDKNDLKMGQKILAHFQKFEDERRAKIKPIVIG